MNFDSSEIRAKAESLGPWYHKVRLAANYVTTSVWGDSQDAVWNATRTVRQSIDYPGKSVLDLGSFDGMWAFEAEEAGAATVIAGDIFQKEGKEYYERFCFARFVRNSKAALIPNIDINDLPSRLDSVYRAWSIPGAFDIIQCTGLLYHVQNPLLALQQMRRCIVQGGALLLETAVQSGVSASTLRFNYDRSFYNDPVTYWIPSELCLGEMLAFSGFAVRPGQIIRGRPDRISLVADAVAFDDHAKIYG